MSAKESHSAQARISTLYTHRGTEYAAASGIALLVWSANQRSSFPIDPYPVTLMSGLPSKPAPMPATMAANAASVRAPKPIWVIR